MQKKIIFLGNDLPEHMIDANDFDRKTVSQIIDQLNAEILWMVAVCDNDHPLVKKIESDDIDMEEAYVAAHSELACITNVGNRMLLVNLPDFVAEAVQNEYLFVKTSKGYTSTRRVGEHGEDAESIYDIVSLLLEGE